MKTRQRMSLTLLLIVITGLLIVPVDGDIVGQVICMILTVLASVGIIIPEN